MMRGKFAMPEYPDRTLSLIGRVLTTVIGLVGPAVALPLGLPLRSG